MLRKWTETWTATMAIQEQWWYTDKGSWHRNLIIVDLIQSGGIIIINYLQNFIQPSSVKVISSQSWITDNNLCWYWHNDCSYILPSSNTWEKWEDFKIKHRIQFERWFTIIFTLGVKPDLSQEGRNTGWGCMRIGCWKWYLGQKGDGNTGMGNFIFWGGS